MLDNPNLKFGLNLMTRQQRKRWNMRLQGLTLKEIAGIEKCSYQAIQDSLRRGMNRVDSEKIGILKIFL